MNEILAAIAALAILAANASMTVSGKPGRVDYIPGPFSSYCPYVSIQTPDGDNIVVKITSGSPPHEGATVFGSFSGRGLTSFYNGSQSSRFMGKIIAHVASAEAAVETMGDLGCDR